MSDFDQARRKWYAFTEARCRRREREAKTVHVRPELRTELRDQVSGAPSGESSHAMSDIEYEGDSSILLPFSEKDWAIHVVLVPAAACSTGTAKLPR